jgi:hypothetical protein
MLLLTYQLHFIKDSQLLIIITPIPPIITQIDNLPLRCFVILKDIYQNEASEFLLKNTYFFTLVFL